MRILIVGGGGREHALAWKLAQSPRVTRLFAAPGSAAIARHAECIAWGGNTAAGHAALADFAQRDRIDLVVVGPEDPLVAGLADALQARGLRVFGPEGAAARLEGSKVFAKAFMARHGIPTAAYRTFAKLPDALAYVDTLPGKFVVKASGLAAGKGVTVCANRAQGRQALRRMMGERVFGDAGNEVVIEGFLAGEEASFLVLAAGEDFLVLPCCQDHKPVGDLDRGPNTGGMGAYAPTPLVTAEVEARVLERIVRPALRGMAAEGHPYRGVLYCGLMIERGEPSVVEFNCRFGDPECEVQMLLLESDLLDLLEAVVDGTLAQARPRWAPGAAACVVMAAPGYPGPPKKGLPIRGLGAVPDSATRVVFHSGTGRSGSSWVTSGGRVLTVTARGDDLRQALQRAYAGVARIGWEGAVLRRDIGLKGLLRQRGGRAQVSVAIYGPAAGRSQADRIARELRGFGIGSVRIVPKGKPVRWSAAALRHRSAGIEACVLLPGLRFDAALAAESAGLPVIGVGLPQPAQRPVRKVLRGKRARGNEALAGPVQAWAEDPAAAARHLVALFAIKYPDVQARLQLAQLQTAPPEPDPSRRTGR